MLVDDFDYELPDELIARYPSSERSGSRLLVVSDSGLHHQRFTDLPQFICPEDLLVFNNTQVMAARLFGKKATGGQVEMLIERIDAPCRARSHLKASKAPRQDSMIYLQDGTELKVLGRDGELFCLEFPEIVTQVLERLGEVPLPPYLGRAQELMDRERYQTIYAEMPGSVAAPTAGLHFDQPLLNKLAEKGVASAYVTLHVGAGTFQPVRSDRIEDHVMHQEWFDVTEATVEAIRQCRERGGRVIAVGSTSARALESAAASGMLRAKQDETSIFISPGYRYRVVDAMITNFHLPRSTLLMLVAAFVGRDRMLDAYRCAIEQGYRFFSYGDAMLLERQEVSHAV
ncbi:MAG: tRNA preQ1(34) S-adenosylmethionine ribosyltransferase-isomerase QueA [Pseudomonadales bacterium]|nr:tRNA preQ1(34) S-adenosylmethionine ribosyltransferase-isomerase QueA [Pseudomonadales bacterium]